MEHQVAIRIFENAKYGSTHGKGLYRRALFNATAEIKHPKLKYLLDFEQFEHWQHGAKTDADIEALTFWADAREDQQLFSWLQHYDPVSKLKARVTGFATLNLNTGEICFLVMDEERECVTTSKLTAKPCKSTQGKNSPQLFATNADTVDDWYTA